MFKIKIGDDGFVVASMWTKQSVLLEGEIEVERLVDIDTEYYDGAAIQSRPEMLATLTGNTVAGISIPSIMTIDGTAYEILDDKVDLEFDTPGTHRVIIHSFPFLDKELILEA